MDSIWGHEHENMPFEKNQSIFQPGSTVATQYKEAEAKQKKVGVFTINGNKCEDFKQIDLIKSKRTMIFKKIDLQENFKKNGEWEEQAEVEKYLEEEIERNLKNYEFEQQGKKFKLPILRLKIDSYEFDMVRIDRLEEKFKMRVANDGFFLIRRIFLLFFL